MCENKPENEKTDKKDEKAPVFKDGKFDLKELLFALSRMQAVSGNEMTAAEELKALCSEHFDETLTDAVGNVVFVKKCGRPGAPKLLVDGHMDEVGMVVTGVSDDGFLSVTSMGGTDRRVLAASDVTIFADKPVYGVFCATPPHLVKGDRRAMPDWKDMRVDTGYTKAELEALGVGVGCILTTNSEPTALMGDFVTGKAFDDRISAACAIAAIAGTDKTDLACDVYVSVSVNEETGGAGPARFAYAVRPEYALIVDVGFDAQPGVGGSDAVKSGGGPVISISAVTDRKLTEDIMAAAKRYDIPYKTSVEPTGTGTNAEDVALTAEGVAVAVMGTPIRNMHTPVETVRLCDMKSLADLIAAVAKSGRIAKDFAGEGYEPPMKPTF